jgi:hypothetical protein
MSLINLLFGWLDPLFTEDESDARVEIDPDG